jgi:hypothetical protein
LSTSGRIFAKRPVERGQAQSICDERHTFLKEQVPEDGVCGHLGVYGDDAAPDDLVSGVGGEEVVDALVDVVEAGVDLLEAAPLGEVCCTDEHGAGRHERETCRGS